LTVNCVTDLAIIRLTEYSPY